MKTSIPMGALSGVMPAILRQQADAASSAPPENGAPQGEEPQEPAAPTEPTDDQYAEGNFPMDFTDEDLARLSPEEREAAESYRAKQEEAPKEEPFKEAATKAEEEPAPETPPKREEPQQEPEPQFDVKKAKDDSERLKTERDELQTKYEDGDIGEDEYKTERTRIDDELVDARAEELAAKKNAQAAQKRREDQWYSQVGKYHDQFPELVSDAHLQGWDATLREVTRAYPTLKDEAAIQLAHKRYAEVAAAAGNPIKGPTVEAPKEEATTQQRRPDPGPRPDLPPSLAHVPASDMAGQDDGRFAGIDRSIDKDPFEGERAFERMSEAEQQAFLEGS